MYDINDFKIGLIYKYTSPSGKVYIGKTINEKDRKSEHKTSCYKRKTYFAHAIKKYGFENFKYEVIIKFKPTLEIEKLNRVLNKLEIRYIKMYNSRDNSYGYNLTNGGEGICGYKHSEEMIEYLKSCPKTEKQISNLELGREGHSEETKLKQKNSKKSKMKRVGKYDLENVLLEEFDSIADAARSLEGSTQKTKHNKIGDCCNEKSKSAYGYT
jgi:hypothetical protein